MALTSTGGTHIGPHHQLREQPNQDYWAARRVGEWQLLCAADGAGSLALSHVGAQLTVTVALSTLEDELALSTPPRQAVEQALLFAREELLGHLDSSLMGCTLALGVLSADEWALGVVGDAFAVVTRALGEHELHRPQAHSEFANITRLLTSDVYEPHLASGEGPLLALSVASDGLAHSSLVGEEPASGFWDAIVRRALADELDVAALFAHMAAQERLDDDTTLVVATVGG